MVPGTVWSARVPGSAEIRAVRYASLDTDRTTKASARWYTEKRDLPTRGTATADTSSRPVGVPLTSLYTASHVTHTQDPLLGSAG